MSIKITGLQQAQDALAKELAKFQGGSYALIGIHESAGAVDGEQMTMATLGAIQHFGNDNIPARRWLDVGVESGTKEYLETIEEGLEKGLSQEQILEQVGALAVGYTQDFILNLQDPPNAPSTIRKKGSSNPLIDTGNLRASVTHTVTNKKPEEGI